MMNGFLLRVQVILLRLKYPEIRLLLNNNALLNTCSLLTGFITK
jgi:hypothetical protein